MNQLRGAALALLLCMGAGNAHSQAIGMFGDPAGAWCFIDVPLGMNKTAHILSFAGGPVTGITGAEFRVEGVPAGLYLTIPTPNPAASVALGDPMQNGCNIAFPVCQSGFQPVSLYTVIIINLADPVGDHTLQVREHALPSNPNFVCPLVTLCDPPVFTKVCVNGAESFLGGTNNCEVAVEQVTWSEVKGLFRKAP